jgi:aminopeptidase N
MRIHLSPVLLLAAGCHAMSGSGSQPRTIVHDLHSFSEPNRVRVTHAALDLTLDFEAREARGTVELDLQRLDPHAPLVLDVNGLAIEEVSAKGGAPLTWKLGAETERLGQPLTIELGSRAKSVRIRYHTTARGEAMQWLAPEQTADGAEPFLFTQGQSILTRSWIPLQDSPGVRITYAARIRCPEGLTAVMSAERLGKDSLGAWRFRLDRPIPPYLIALACGRLEFRKLSARCGVWAEPGVSARAAAELADTERMVQAAETLSAPTAGAGTT